MKINRIDHISINVGDFNKSLKFYRDILGLKLLNTIRMPEYSITYLGLPDGGRIELIDYRIIQKRSETDNLQIGLRHIAFNADNLEEWEKLLKNKGVKIILSATDLVEVGVKVLVFEDPDGTILEICKAL